MRLFQTSLRHSSLVPDNILGIPTIQEIVVGFRSYDGIVQSTQSFETLAIPNLVRGKGSHSWDPGFALETAERFLVFLNEELSKPTARPDDVWRITFTPKQDIQLVKLLPEEVVAEVSSGEDRIGFLPKEFYESRLN